MVTPQGDLRAGADRAPSLTLSFMAGAMLTFPLFAEKLSVLLPALCLTLTAPYIYNSMARATCNSLSFLIPPIWNGAAEEQSRMATLRFSNLTAPRLHGYWPVRPGAS